MKKFFVLLTFIALFSMTLGVSALAGETDEWKEAPIITGVYESAKETFILTWEGNADLYQVYLDGKNVATVNLNSAVIEMKAGRHHLQVVPVKVESKDIDTSLSLNLNGNGIGKLVLGEIGVNIDLAALGVDPKDILQGTQSKAFPVSYTVDPIFSASPEITAAATDFNDRVILSFTDKYSADVYTITVKSGKDINYVLFDTTDAGTADYVFKSNSLVTVVLDPDYLKTQGCMIPELDEKYGFSVMLGKYAVNLIDGAVEETIVHESKDSKLYSYTPLAAWKNAPEITYVSQTADGQVTLRWEHDDNGLGCEYEVRRIEKVLGIRRGEKVLGKTPEREFVVEDLMNGEHSFVVVPVYAREEGLASGEASVDVKNDWVAAPVLTCELLENDRIRLTWSAAEGVESYHIIVYAGSGSLLRYVNLDYKKYTEIDVSAGEGEMEHIFHYDNSLAADSGIKLKFEIYGLRHAADGSEQRSAASTQTIRVE